MKEVIRHRLIGYKPRHEEIFKATSVLLPLIEKNGELHLLFEKRSMLMNTQPGEICFPGGKVENGELPMLSAIRETMEEIGVKEDLIEVLGELDTVVTPFNLLIIPFVGIVHIESSETLELNKSEVDFVFTVPLRHFIDFPPEKYLVSTKLELPHDFPFDKIPQGKDYAFRRGEYDILFYQYEDYVIWGLTAKIINNFVQIIRDYSV